MYYCNMLYNLNGKIRLTKEQCESLVDSNPYLVEYVLKLAFTVLKTAPGMTIEELEGEKWLNTHQAARYIKREKKYLDWMCTKRLIEYNVVKGKREFDIEVLKKWRADNTVKYRAMTPKDIEQFYIDWAKEQSKKKKK